MTAGRKTSLILFAILLAGGGILCAVRWRAWFVNPDEPVWTGDTIPCSFHTFAEKSLDGFAHYEDGHSVIWQDLKQPGTLAFLLLGDVHNSIDSLQWAALAQRHPGIDFYAQLGDLLERTYFFYVQQLAAGIQSTPFRQLPIVTVPGNHEYRKGIVRRLPELWYSTFPQPLNGPQRFIGSTYYVDFPDLRLIAIDTNGLQRLSDYTIVNTWVRKALQEAGDRFTVVIMHHPVFSAAKGRQNPFVRLTFRRVLGNADIVFAGHDHNYARRLPFIVTNSAKKHYRQKKNLNVERICSGKQVYNLVTLRRHNLSGTTGDTLCIETRLLDTGEEIDLVQIVHQPDTTGADMFLRTYIAPADSLNTGQLGVCEQ